MKIEKAYEVCCYECGELFDEINIIELNQEDIYLCDNCLKELESKIKKYKMKNKCKDCKIFYSCINEPDDNDDVCENVK